MKQRILFMLIGIVAMGWASVGTSAQNANRNGWVVELQGARVIGTVYETPDFQENKDRGLPAYRLKSGIAGAVNFGYRWTTSQFCAVEAKFFVSDNFADAKRLVIGLMPGFRYTTKEIAGNTSMYIGANAGFGVAPITDGDMGLYVPTQANVGFNLGNMFSIGLFVDYNICVGGDVYVDDIEVDDKYSWADLKSNAAVGLKLGLRF